LWPEFTGYQVLLEDRIMRIQLDQQEASLQGYYEAECLRREEEARQERWRVQKEAWEKREQEERWATEQANG
jgi:hypothetical protein